jgi:hypothetical protein
MIIIMEVIPKRFMTMTMTTNRLGNLEMCITKKAAWMAAFLVLMERFTSTCRLPIRSFA